MPRVHHPILASILCIGALTCATGAGATPAPTPPGSGTDGKWLDPTFSGDGKKIVEFANLDAATAVAFGPDGSIVAVGTSYFTDERGDADMVVLKLRSDGSLDTSFGEDGVVAYGEPTTEYAERGYGVAVQPDGSVIAVGSSMHRSTFKGALLMLRLLADGNPDTSFAGGDGIVRADRTKWTDAWSDVLLLPDGKIIVCGTTGGKTGGTYEVYVARYRSNGRLDRSFGVRGEAVLDVGDHQISVDGCDLNSHGDILVGATQSEFPPRNTAIIASFSSAGRVNESFGGGDGFFSDRFHQNSGTEIDVLPDGSIVATISTNESVGVIRVTAGGKLDKTFGTRGRAEAHFAAGTFADSIATTPQRIVVAGGVASDSGGYDSHFALAGFTYAGELDRSFGAGGMLQTSLRRQSSAWGVAFQPDGRLVAVGATGHWYFYGPRAYAFVRYLT